jgi:hypothetical protein
MRLTQLGPGPAQFFRDACELMVEQPTRVTVTHVVSRLLREVESGLGAVISALYAPGVAGDEASILAVSRRARLPWPQSWPQHPPRLDG